MEKTYLSQETSLAVAAIVGLFFIGLGYLNTKKVSSNKKIKIYDMRNLYSPKKMKKLGYAYYSVGR